MRNGRLRLVAGRRGARAPLSGHIDIDKFRISNDPSLARLIEGGEEGASDTPAPDATSGGGQQLNVADVGFDRMSAEFQRGDGDLTVSEGVLRGLAVGATFEGSINFASEGMSLHGT